MLAWRVLPVLALAAGALASPDLNSTADDWDYFLFVRQWGVSFCEEGHCTIKPLERFSIHGLWPERNDHSWPQCCDSHYPFRMEALAPLMRDLVHYWFSYTAGIKGQCRWASTSADLAAATPQSLQQQQEPEGVVEQPTQRQLLVAGLEGKQQQEEAEMHTIGDEGNAGPSPDFQFWRHEWEKHGTCSMDALANEYDYFSAVLDLHRQHDLDAILRDAGIVPSHTPYRVSEILAAVRSATGYQPSISCRAGDVMELTLCVTKRMELMDCPGRAEAENWACADKAHLPPAGRWSAVV